MSDSGDFNKPPVSLLMASHHINPENFHRHGRRLTLSPTCS
jgi:hypothetical protein